MEASPTASSAFSAEPTSSPPPSATPPTTPPTTPSAIPTISPREPTHPPTPCCESSPLPSPSHVAGLAASDRFWENWYDTCWFGAFPIVSSLEEITSQSHLVVRGTIANIYSRESQFWHVAYADVAVTEVLKGEPMYGEAGTIEVQIGFGSDLEELRSALPRHDHLWFVIELEDHAGRYQITDYPQVGVLRDIGGVVEVIMPEAIANAFSRRHYPIPLDGTSFEQLVEQVRRLVAEASGVLDGYARWTPTRQPDRTRFAAC